MMLLKNAIIVDDEKDICLLISLALKNQGVASTTANSISEGLDVIQHQNEEVQFAFLDLNLPDGIGFELIPHIRKAFPSCVITIISAYDGVQERKNIQELNVNYFIKKPFSKKQIIEIILQHDTKNLSN